MLKKFIKIFTKKISSLFLGVIFLISPLTPLLAQDNSSIFNNTDFKKNISKEINYQEENSIIDGEYIIKYKKEKINLKNIQGKNKASSIEKKKGFEEIDETPNLNMRLIKSADSLEKLKAELKDYADIEYIEPNYRRFPNLYPNDPDLSKTWGLENTGQTANGYMGTSGADIAAPNAWDIEKDSYSSTIIAVIDTGVRYTHEDLAVNMWDGSACVDENNESISGGCPNGGWDFEENDNDPNDLEGHGTAISGIIAGVSNNSKGATGISYYNKLKIMAIKFDFSIFSEIKAIQFAENNGAKVINASFTGVNFSQAEKEAIDSFSGIVVASSGNSARNNEVSHMYPSDYSSANIISVAATDQNDDLSSFSNYGNTSVDIAAPGENIYSTSVTSIDLFSENFDDASIPNIPSTFTNGLSGDWISEYWSGSYSDKFVYPGENYNSNSNAILYLSTPVNTSSVDSLSLQFYLEADIEAVDAETCTYDYLLVQTDNNDGSWVDQEKLCGFHSEDTININITSAKSTSMRFRFVWITNSENDPALFYYDPQTPLVDDVFLKNAMDSYGYFNGTSFAAPYVSGAAGILFSKNNSYTTQQVKEFILNSGDPLSSLNSKISSGKRLNINKMLSGERSIYRFWSDQKQGHFYTADATEKDNIIATWPDIWHYEGEAFNAYSESAEGITPIYRFWSDSKQHHFYTASGAEKDYIIATWSDTWHFEGIAYYAYQTEQPNTNAVHRFWSDSKQGHFFTSSEGEKDNIIATWPDIWSYEGVGYYVPEE